MRDASSSLHDALSPAHSPWIMLREQPAATANDARE
jgi:hypothetical protein